MSRRILIYVQHLLGIGHLARTARIAKACAAAGHKVRVVSGGEPIPSLSFGGAEVVQLSPIRAADSAFSGLIDTDGHPLTEESKAKRAADLLAAAHQFNPEVILVEMFPFGRRQMRFELIPLLEAYHGRIPLAVSIRDVLSASLKPEKQAYILETLRRFDLKVLVHGDATLIPFSATFPAADSLGDQIRYTGYIAPKIQTDTGRQSDEILISAGGGAVGAPLFQAALAARPLTRYAKTPWRIVTGANLPHTDRQALLSTAPQGVIVEAFRDDFQSLLGQAQVSVSQGGYNTVLEGLALGARMVLVPFAEEGESEQGVRVRLIAECGWAEAVSSGADGRTIDPAHLARKIDAAGEMPRPLLAGLKLDGAEETARLLGCLS